MSQTKCKVCGEFKGGKEPDPCLGYLPGIAHACCGHGETKFAYCCGWNGCKPNEDIGGFDKLITIKGHKEWIATHRLGFWIKRSEDAIDYMKSLGARIP